jgi:signal transduction histidine kinase
VGADLSGLGLMPNEVRGKTLYEYFDNPDPKFLPIAAHLDALQGQPAMYEFDWKGRTFFFQVRPLRDVHSKITGTIGTALDITQRKMAEDFYRQNTEQTFRYQEVLLELAKMEHRSLEESLKKIIQWDAQTLVTERVSIWFFNQDRSEIICKVLFQLSAQVYQSGSSLKAKDYPHYFQALEESRTIAAHDAAQDPRTREFRESYLKPLGITSMMDLPIRSQGRVVGILCHEHIGPPREWSVSEQEFAASVADVVALSLEASERRRTEETLRQTTEELRKSNKELESFAYIASHDLQEPLHKIAGFSERLIDLQGKNLDPQGRDYLERINRAAHGMRELINDLLLYSRVTLRNKAFEEVDLHHLLLEVRSDLELRLNEVNGTLEIGPLPTIQADRTQMRQLFQNLISNALKFSHRSRPPRVVVQNNPSPAHCVTLSVADNGIGMEEEFLSEIFKPFYRLHGKADYEGSGIGLALCEKIVKHHGGSISVESKKGEGSVFKVTLPRGTAHE